MLHPSRLVPVLSFLALVACSSDPEATPAGTAPVTGTSPPPACVEGETRCEGEGVATCTVAEDGTTRFDAPVACATDAVCKAGACAAPTAAQKKQAGELAEMVGYLRANTAWHSPLDWDGLVSRGKTTILRGDGTDRAYFGALFDAFVAVPQGHQGLYLERGCGKLVPMSGSSQRGVCGRPHARGIVVTHVKAGNVLGLAPGDLVVGLGAAKEHAVLDALAARPMCVTSRPSASYRDASTATTFADLLAPSETFEVEAPDGTRRSVTVPATSVLGAGSSTALSCQDPLGRETSKAAYASLRPDGVAVIRLPSFVDPEVPFPTANSASEFEAYKEGFLAKIQVAFDGVKTAKAIVWDVRGNGGGLTQVGLDIASGFPGASASGLSACRARVPDSSPPAFGDARYAAYALQPGGRFAFSGKVAVLIDGLDYSAADYFPLAVKSRTSAVLVGAPTAGGFGATSETKRFAGPPSFTVSVDLNRCELDDGTPLEGRSVEPHVAADYAPKDLAAGKDTVLERAVTALLR